MDKQHVVLITGAGSGIGRLSAETLAAQGHTVYASMRGTQTHNAETRAALEATAKSQGQDLHVIDLDVTDEQSVEAAVHGIIERSARIDVLVNNAGVVGYGVIEAFGVEQAQRLFDVNVFGPLRLNRAVLPHMREQGKGVLIHVSSGLGRIVMPSMGLYAASKFALESLAETLRYELAGTGVDSVIVEPGAYPTRINDAPSWPQDTAREAAYGKVAELGKQLNIYFRDETADRDPFEVVEAIIGLINDTPATRALRTPVGVEAAGLLALNQACAQVQGAILSAFGLDEMAALSD